MPIISHQITNDDKKYPDLYCEKMCGEGRGQKTVSSYIYSLVELILNRNFVQLRKLLSSVLWSAKADRVHIQDSIYTHTISCTQLHMESG